MHRLLLLIIKLSVNFDSPSGKLSFIDHVTSSQPDDEMGSVVEW